MLARSEDVQRDNETYLTVILYESYQRCAVGRVPSCIHNMREAGYLKMAEQKRGAIAWRQSAFV